MRICVPAVFTALALVAGSCSSGPTQKPTFPVTGVVLVDGKPAADLQVTLHNVQGMDSEAPTHTAGRTDQDGKFAVSTYSDGDGAPAGEYTLTFVWNQLNRMSMSYEGDKLKGKYEDPQGSQFKVTVKPGKPVDMGRIELSTS